MFSLIFDGKNTKATSSFKVGGSVTKTSATTQPLLGSTVCRNQKETKKSASKGFFDHFSLCLNRLNAAPLRGEYKNLDLQTLPGAFITLQICS